MYSYSYASMVMMIMMMGLDDYDDDSAADFSNHAADADSVIGQ